MILCLKRKQFQEAGTIGELWVGNQDEGRYFCDTLEDMVRPEGEAKVHGKTAIPTGLYKVSLTESQRFKRVLPILHDVPNFEGIRIHAGNAPKDTEGCILVGKQYQHGILLTDSKKTLQKLMVKLEAAVKAGEEILIEVG